MVYGGEQKPGAAAGVRPHGRRPGSGRRYGLAVLAVLVLWGAWSMGVLGCTTLWSGYSRITEAPGALFANMRLSPGEISRLEHNAHYYKLMGQPELGLREMELAYQQNPDNLQIADLLAQNYEELGKFDAARQLYQEAINRQGPHAILANNLCFSYYNEGRWQEAEACFRQTLARDPGNVSARNNLGLLFCRLDRQDEARRLWQEAEGAAAADAKMSQALAALGMTDPAVYARRTESGPPVTEATRASTSKTAATPVPTPAPAKNNTWAQTLSPKASTPPASTPAPVEAGPRPEAVKFTSAATATVTVAPAPARGRTSAQPVSPKASEPRLAVKPPVKTSGPVAAKPRKEAQKQAPVSKPALPAVKTTSAPTPGAIAAKVAAPVPAPAQPQTPIKSEKQVTQNPAAQTPGRVKAVPQANILEAADPAWAAPLDVAALLWYPNYLTCAELVCTAIEVRNGTWTKNLARHTRSLLWQEGFNVAKIGNHIDFGAAKTMIYYRPGTERVALTLARTVFPEAELSPSLKLNKGVDIKILLGADLLQRPQLMARLVAQAN